MFILGSNDSIPGVPYSVSRILQLLWNIGTMFVVIYVGLLDAVFILMNTICFCTIILKDLKLFIVVHYFTYKLCVLICAFLSKMDHQLYFSIWS